MENCQVRCTFNSYCMCMPLSTILYSIEPLYSNQLPLSPGAFHPTPSRSISQTSTPSSSTACMTAQSDDQQPSRPGSDTTPTPPVPLVLPTKHTSPFTTHLPLAYHTPENFLKLRNHSVTTTETDDSVRQSPTQNARISSRHRRRARGNLESVESSPTTPNSHPVQSTSSSAVSESPSTIPERPVFSQYTPPRLLGSSPMLKQPSVRKHIYSGAVCVQHIHLFSSNL
jgi:hypothetical protein